MPNMSLEEARALMQRTGQDTSILAELPSHGAGKPRQRSRYDEHHKVQEPFVKSFREIQAKVLFHTVQGLIDIELTAQRQVSSNDEPNNIRRQVKEKILGARNKALGYKAGWPDIEIVWCFEGELPQTGFIEAKYGDGDLSESQRLLHTRLIKMGFKVEVMKSRRDGMLILKKWNLLPKSCESFIY